MAKIQLRDKYTPEEEYKEFKDPNVHAVNDGEVFWFDKRPVHIIHIINVNIKLNKKKSKFRMVKP